MNPQGTYRKNFNKKKRIASVYQTIGKSSKAPHQHEMPFRRIHSKQSPHGDFRYFCFRFLTGIEVKWHFLLFTCRGHRSIVLCLGLLPESGMFRFQLFSIAVQFLRRISLIIKRERSTKVLHVNLNLKYTEKRTDTLIQSVRIGHQVFERTINSMKFCTLCTICSVEFYISHGSGIKVFLYCRFSNSLTCASVFSE